MICHSVLGPGIRRTPVHVRPGYYWGLGSPSLRFGMRCLACFAIVCCAVIQDALLAAEDFPGRSLENRPGYVANLVSLRSLVFLRSVVDHLALEGSLGSFSGGRFLCWGRGRHTDASLQICCWPKTFNS